MKRPEVARILRALGATVPEQQGRAGWLISTCPFAFCKHESGVSNAPTFGVSDDQTKYTCFACGEKGHMEGLAITLGALRRKHGSMDAIDFKLAMELTDQAEEGWKNPFANLPDYDEIPEVVKDYPFSEEWLDTFTLAETNKMCVEYMKSRGITKVMCQQLGLRFDTYERRICFPVRNWDGVLVGLHGRAIEAENTLRYKVYKFEGHHNTDRAWYGEHWVDHDMPVVMAESVFDVASLLRVYPNVICPLSAGIGAKKAERVSGLLDVITIFDYGSGGNSARRNLKKYLPHTVFKHILLDEDDKDPGEMSETRLELLIKKSLYNL